MNSVEELQIEGTSFNKQNQVQLLLVKICTYCTCKPGHEKLPPRTAHQPSGTKIVLTINTSCLTALIGAVLSHLVPARTFETAPLDLSRWFALRHP
jgi:hypothetical protein